jgi:hypothetical protein
MTMTVTSAITRVRNYLDDINTSSDSRWSDSEIAIALEVSLDLLTNEAVQGGVHQTFRKVATSALANGNITVPANIKIISLFLLTGNTRTAIYPAGARNRNFVDLATAGTVEFDYIAKNNVNWGLVLPATPATEPITYGSVDVDDNVWDAYLCTLAAIDLAIKEGEVSPVLMDRSERYRKAMIGKPVTGQISVFPQAKNILSPSSYYQLYFYMKGPTTLEVYR